MKPESAFIAKIHKLVPLQIYRMKNHNKYVGGIADCWYSAKRGDLWVEYKYEPTLPVTRNVTADLSALQKKWLRERHSEGRNIAVVIGCKDKGIVLTEPEQWERAYSAYEFAYLLRPKEDIAQWIKEQCL